MAVQTTLPAAKISLAQNFGISDLNIAALLSLLVPPVPPSIPIPPIPTIPVPKIPIPLAGISVPNFPDLALGFFKMPLTLFPQLILKVTSPSISPPDLFKEIIGLIAELLMDVLKALGLLVGVPKLLLSVLMVIVKDLCVMLLCDVVSQVLGTGALVKIVATLGGVV
jgi:hypothetical protein